MKPMKLKHTIPALLLALALAGCATKQDASTPVSSTAPASSQAASSAPESLPESTPESTSTPTALAPGFDPSGEFKQVGEEGFGFVSVPEDWANFQDLDGGTALQFSDLSAQYIVSLDNGENAGGFTDAETWAQGIMAVMESIDPISFEGAKVDFVGYDTYQCYGIFEDGTFWVVNIFPIEDGSLRYLSIEGPATDDFYTIFDTISQSYTV